jgi:glycosyltransferase involved in cell wall biosynthesis
MSHSTAARLPPVEASVSEAPVSYGNPHEPIAGRQAAPSVAVLIAVPTLHAGAADVGVVDLVRILASAGHRAVVVSDGGRLQEQVDAAGGQFVHASMASKNPLVMIRNVVAIARLVRTHRIDVVHAHGRAPAWSACIAARLRGVPFITTWYKGFREQNILKHVYNSVMVRGVRIVAVSDQIAELIHDRYNFPWDRIAVVPTSVDALRFDPAAVSTSRIEAVRRAWGAGHDTKVILVVGRMIRRKGHHLVVNAVRRLKDMGLKDFICVFVGEDQGRTRYTAELWDLVLATGTREVIRMAGPVEALPAALAAASVVVSAATQAEGLQRSILEAQAMARPVVVSDLGAGPEVVLAPPSTPEDRMTGLRFSSGDDAALAAALIRLFSLPESVRWAIGARGRDWVARHFDAASVTELTLKLYSDVVRGAKSKKETRPPKVGTDSGAKNTDRR